MIVLINKSFAKDTKAIFDRNILNQIAEIIDEAIARGDVDVVWTQLGLVNNEAAAKALKAGLKVVQNKCTKIEHRNLF